MNEKPYNYDPKTNTVRVSRHDLARLLLMFRAELERQEDRYHPWSHMRDYDKSFERLADAVDSGNDEDQEPDLRMRCKNTDVYRWTDSAPYNGEPISAMKVTAKSLTGRVIATSSHYAQFDEKLGFLGHALCGFSFSREEARNIKAEPTCAACVREMKLMAGVRQTPDPGW